MSAEFWKVMVIVLLSGAVWMQLGPTSFGIFFAGMVVMMLVNRIED